MFSPIRWRLVGWSLGVLGLILLVAGAVAYADLAYTLEGEVDRGLRARGEEVAVRLTARAEGDLRLTIPAFQGGFFYLVITPEGAILVNPQGVDIDELPPVTSLPAYLTLALDDGPVRLYLRPFPNQVQQPAVLVVGQGLAAEAAALHRLLLVLLVSGAVGLLLSCAGAWFLAGRALVPIAQAFRRQQEFVADASHELRTPLTVLHAAVDLLHEHRAEPLSVNQELFDDVRGEIGRLERLSSDLLALARADLAELDLAVGDVDLGMLASDVVRRMLPLAQSRGVTLHAAAPADAAVVEADPDRVQQVLLILLDNALKHTPAGGRVTVSVQRRGGEALVQVSDTGEGIAAADLARIFDRFYRVNRARSRGDGGAGLGLAIARALVQAHGGQLSLTSAPGRGTTATVRLPRALPTPTLAGRLGRLAAGVVHRPSHH